MSLSPEHSMEHSIEHSIRHVYAPKGFAVITAILSLYMVIATVLCIHTSDESADESINDRRSVMGQCVLSILLFILSLLMITDFGREHNGGLGALMMCLGLVTLIISIVRTTTDKASSTVGKLSKQVQINMNTSFLVISMVAFFFGYMYYNAEPLTIPVVVSPAH